MKTCTICGETKELSEFGKGSRNNDGKLNYCKACANAKAREYRSTPAGREKRKEHHAQWRLVNPTYKQEYKTNEAKRARINLSSVMSTRKITEHALMDLLDKQQGCCAICEIDFGLLSRAYNVDHDHTTGQVRGLLCPDCNTKLGTYEKWVLPHAKAINEYLKRG